ncbi:MAG: hypothetical protein ACR2QW_12860 [bacterium]
MTTLQPHIGEKTLGHPGVNIFLLGFFMLLTVAPNTGLAQQTDGETEGLKLPEDIAERSALGNENEVSEAETQDADSLSLNEDRKYLIEERRIGGRLERVTVRRKNGLDEVYENPNVDSMWITEDKELGEVQNVRRWTIGSW